MNASRPEFLYEPDIKQLTEAILWLLKEVDNDIAARALSNVIFEREMKGTVMSREDVADTVANVCHDVKTDTLLFEYQDKDMADITETIIQSDWWEENTLGVESSYQLYKHVEQIIDSMKK